MVDTQVFKDARGFHPELGIYGGGEPYFQIKLQRLGYKHQVNPEWSVRHLAMRRGYSFNNDDLWRNFLLSAWAVGGVEAQEPYYLGLLNKLRKNHEGDTLKTYITNLMMIREDAISAANEDRRWIDKHATKSYKDVIDATKA